MQPAKARLAIYSSVGGTLTSFSEVHLRKASCSILRSLCGSLRCCKCLQCAKAEPIISVNCRHRSQAAGPIHVKSGGRDSDVIPASRKQHSGNHLVVPDESLSGRPRSRCRNAVHFSKALGISCACGASWLVVSLLAPICIKEQHSSKAWIPNRLQPGASTVRRA